MDDSMTTAEEREQERLEKQRLRQAKYRSQSKERARPHAIAVWMPESMVEQLEYLLLEHDHGGGRSGFMKRAFQFYAAHLLGLPAPVETDSPVEGESEPPRQKKAPRTPAKGPKEPTARERSFMKAEADAANRVPIRIEFAREHHKIPWGMRQILWDNGIRHRKDIWRGRLPPDRVEHIRESVGKFDGVLEVTGELGQDPKWEQHEWKGKN